MKFEDVTWPDAADAAGWAAAAGELGCCPPGLIVGALRALGATGDRRLVDALASALSERVKRRLRSLISTRHANDGEDIVADAHCVVMTAVFDPGSADGAEMIDHFWPRVMRRGIDAARVERRHVRRYLPLAADVDGEPTVPLGARVDAGAGSVDVSHVLLKIRDPRKRAAFRLFMMGMRVRQGTPCVAGVIGCDPKTAASWIREARAILAAEVEARA